MTNTLRRRGPDAEGYWNDDNNQLWFGHRRLKIVDLTYAGSQPMTSADGQYVITYNGEIYNSPQLRSELEAASIPFAGHSDTEVLVNAIAHWGIDEACRKLIGMFAFAVWHKPTRTMTLVRDPMGKKPLLWCATPGGVMFASGLNALLTHPDCPRGLDPEMVASFLRTGHVPDAGCIMAGVDKVPPGGIVTIDLDRRSVETLYYWRLTATIERAHELGRVDRPEAAIDAVAELLDQAVEQRLMADVPVGALLSGGIDSSLVVALMQRHSADPIKTFTIGYAEAHHDESHHAARIAAHLGTDHFPFQLTPADAIDAITTLAALYDEPFADVSQIPTLVVAKKARAEVNVVLTGDGGDELFAGYNRHVAAHRLLPSLNRVPNMFRRAAARGMTMLSPDSWSRLLQFLPDNIRPNHVGEKMHKLAPLIGLDDWNSYLQITSQWRDVDQVRLNGEGNHAAPLKSQMLSMSDSVERLRFLDMASYLPGDILVKIDRATMANGLEARAPLLDRRLVELSWRIPTSIHLHDGSGKWILRSLLERHVPRSLFHRPKTGFGIPLDSWLRGPLREWADALLSRDALAANGHVDPDAVRAIWQSHLSGRSNAQYGLWNVLMLQAWINANAHLLSRPL